MEGNNKIQPCADYLAKASTPSCVLPLDPNRRQLLILDLNGTLISRSKNKKRGFTARPHYQSFLDYVFANFSVMVWSSATEHSVTRMCKIFDPSRHPLLEIWDRKHFNMSKEHFYSGRETVKDLDLVWRAMPEFDATNTIILDDTASKLVCQPYNLIQVSTFEHYPVLARQKRDNDLCKVVNYLRILKLQSNVANFIRSNPFDLRMDWGIVPNDELDYRGVFYSKRGKPKVIDDHSTVFFPPSTPPGDTTSTLPEVKRPLLEYSELDPEPDVIPVLPRRISKSRIEKDYVALSPSQSPDEEENIPRSQILRKRNMTEEEDEGGEQQVYPLSNKFPRLRATPKSPPPPSHPSKNKKPEKVNIQSRSEKPPLRPTTHAALQAIQKNIKQRKKRMSFSNI